LGVIGNSAYQNAPRVTNPAHDAPAIADLLRSAHFDTVELKLDLAAAAMRDAFRKFNSIASDADADVAIGYFAGHSVQDDGVNYLVPVDAALDGARDIEDETISLKRLLRVVGPTRRLRLILLDACRKLPPTVRSQQALGAQALGCVTITRTTALDTLIGFSAVGTWAEDTHEHSQLAAALLNHLATSNVDLSNVLALIRADVLAATDGRQRPFVYGTFSGSNVKLAPRGSRRSISVSLIL
jgi:uncharacterized caspase-like protein